MAHFSTSRKMPRTSNSLFSIKQGEKETLRDFMAHFNTVTLEVRDLNEDIAISIMKRGLRRFRFIYSLDKILPQTYAELLERVYKYIRVNEGTSDRCQIKGNVRKRNKRKMEL